MSTQGPPAPPPKPDRAELRRQKRALRAELAARKELARAELARRRAELGLPQERERRRRWPWILLLVLLLLLLLQRCECAPPEDDPPPPLGVGEEGVGEPVEVEVPEPPLSAPEVSRRERPAYVPPVPEPVPWLERFHLQVAARSPRLAECFVGMGAPGTLKWTVSVVPETGRVSEHELEPTLASAELSREQRTCVLGVLSEPVYDLGALASDGASGRSTPVRVGLVIEF